MSGTPRYYSLGAKDSSAAKDLPKLQELGTVVLKSCIFASKGPKVALVNGTNVANIFGDDTFDSMKSFYKHPTRFLSRFLGYGSTAEVERIIPTDALNPANLSIYIDILEDLIPNYVRDSFGNYVYDNNGDLKVDSVTPTINGYRVKFIKDFTNTLDGRALGSLDPINGTMSKVVDGETILSRMYPIIQVNGKSQGSEGNNLGLGFNSFTSDEVDGELLTAINTMLYGFKMYKRSTSTSSAKIITTLENENVLTCSLKPNTKNPNTEAIVSLEDIYMEKYYNETNVDKEIRYKDIEGIYFYQEYIDFVLSKFLENEQLFVTNDVKEWDDGEMSAATDWFDFGSDLTGKQHLINLFTCESTSGKPYFTIIKDKTLAVTTGNQAEINISNNTPIWLNGGSDGTMSVDVLHNGTIEVLKEYSNASSLRQNNIIFPANYFVDSGYPLNVKKAAFDFIGLRKDTVICLSTEIYSDLMANRFSEGNSLGVLRALNTYALLAPESIYFNTECARAYVVVGCGKHTGIKEYIPSTYNVMSYVAEMMGGLTWKEDKMFDDSCYERFADEVFPNGIPETVKTTYWKLGGIVPEPTNRGKPKFIGLCTLYSNPTSVMNNIFTAHAVSVCERLAKYSWLDVSGDVKSTNAVFIKKVNDNLLAKHTGMFANVFNSVPVASLTNRDLLNGNSYSVTTKLYGNVSKTEGVHNTEVFRNDTI